jgi:hypothetical protein
LELECHLYYERKIISHPSTKIIPPGKHRHIAIAKIGKNIYWGWNNSKTRPQIQNQKEDGFIVANYHAETHLLFRIPKNKIHKAIIYVTRISKNKELTYSKPCSHCLFTLLNRGVKITNIWYTDHFGIWCQMTHADAGENNVKQTRRYLAQNRASITKNTK